MTTSAPSDIIKSVSFANLLNQRDAIHERITQAQALLHEAYVLAEAAHMGNLKDHLQPRYHGTSINIATIDGRDEVLKRLDGEAWKYLMEESGVKSYMDATARKEWGEAIANGTHPPMSRENVAATFRTLYESRGEMFERGVLAIFKGLAWDYKTNQPFKFGKRVILSHFSSSYVYAGGCDRLDDLQRVCCILDGKPEPDIRNGVGYAVRSVHRLARPGHWAGEYFKLAWFKKGTAHVTFLRSDLVEQMNRILVKHYPGALASTVPGTRGR